MENSVVQETAPQVTTALETTTEKAPVKGSWVKETLKKLAPIGAILLLAVLLVIGLNMIIAARANSGKKGDGHGHSHSGGIGIGYMGIKGVDRLDDQTLGTYSDRVRQEAYAKAGLDKIRFIFFGVVFILVFLSFAKIPGLSDRLSKAIDWYTMGTVTGVILIALIVPTGIILTLYYMPVGDQIYSSVEAMTRSGFLAFIRNLHNWASELFIFLMLLHILRTVSTKTFLGNRKFIWLTGAVLFVVGWVAFLSGSFMRGDQESLEGFEHMMYSFKLIPLGKYVSRFFTGEYAIMKLTAFHIGVTMLAIGVLLALHVLMRKVYVHIQRRWKKALIYSFALTVFLVAQSIFMEAPFIRGLAAGGTVRGIEVTKPPWPIYFLISGENLFGATAMIYSMLVFLPLVIFPYVIELLPISNAKKARVGEIAFYAGSFFMLAISYWAAAGKIMAHIF